LLDGRQDVRDIAHAVQDNRLQEDGQTIHGSMFGHPETRIVKEWCIDKQQRQVGLVMREEEQSNYPLRGPFRLALHKKPRLHNESTGCTKNAERVTLRPRLTASRSEALPTSELAAGVMGRKGSG
jgi:hypothetical protein